MTKPRKPRKALAPLYRAKIRTMQRELFRGATTAELAESCGGDVMAASKALHRMPDAYIADWRPTTTPKGGRPAAVWRVVVPPANVRPPAKQKLPQKNITPRRAK